MTKKVQKHDLRFAMIPSSEKKKDFVTKSQGFAKQFQNRLIQQHD